MCGYSAASNSPFPTINLLEREGVFLFQDLQHSIDVFFDTVRNAEHQNGCAGVNGGYRGDPIVTLHDELKMGNMTSRQSEKTLAASDHDGHLQNICNISNIGSSKDQGRLILLLTGRPALLI
jgi:hypothetical protein